MAVTLRSLMLLHYHNISIFSFRWRSFFSLSLSRSLTSVRRIVFYLHNACVWYIKYFDPSIGNARHKKKSVGKRLFCVFYQRRRRRIRNFRLNLQLEVKNGTRKKLQCMQNKHWHSVETMNFNKPHHSREQLSGSYVCDKKCEIHFHWHHSSRLESGSRSSRCMEMFGERMIATTAAQRKRRVIKVQNFNIWNHYIGNNFYSAEGNFNLIILLFNRSTHGQ